jgi:hypothetical protein
MEEFKLDRISLKDIAILLPLLGAVLAITYDVGFFYGIGIEYFTLFSLQEHILFALQVIPTAFALAFAAPSGMLAYRAGARAVDKNTPPIPTGKVELSELLSIQEKVRAYLRISQRWLLFYSLLFIAFGSVMVALHQYFVGVIAIMSGVGGLIGYAKKGGNVPSAYFVLWYLVFYTCISFALGVQVGWYTLHSTKPLEIIVTKNGGQLEATLIRSGDRGMLVFDPTTRSVQFLLWDDVKGFRSASQK